jgi:CheY-like chemotaxis protein
MAARTLELFLVQHGHTVHVAHSGQDGIEAARRFEPEVVLCDIGLPGLDGYEVARTLRGAAPVDAPTLVAITGYGQEGDRRRAREAGFDRHLTKPIDLGELSEFLAGLD